MRHLHRIGGQREPLKSPLFWKLSKEHPSRTFPLLHRVREQIRWPFLIFPWRVDWLHESGIPHYPQPRLTFLTDYEETEVTHPGSRGIRCVGRSKGGWSLRGGLRTAPASDSSLLCDLGPGDHLCTRSGWKQPSDTTAQQCKMEKTPVSEGLQMHCLLFWVFLPRSTSSWNINIYHVGKMCMDGFHDGLKILNQWLVVRLFRFINMLSAFCCTKGAAKVSVFHTQGMEVGVWIRVFFFLLFNSFAFSNMSI